MESVGRQARQAPTNHAQRQHALPTEVAHDVRHCAATIILLTQALAVELDDRVAARSALEGITNCARTIAAMCDERRGTGSTRVDVVAEYVVAQTRLIHAGPVSLVTSPVETSASQIDVVRIVDNLVGNARAAAGNEGALAIVVSAIEGRAVIEVGDSGPGFPDAAPEASGLGLSIVAGLAEKLGGSLTVQRSSLGGALVTVELLQDLPNEEVGITTRIGAG